VRRFPFSADAPLRPSMFSPRRPAPADADADDPPLKRARLARQRSQTWSPSRDAPPPAAPDAVEDVAALAAADAAAADSDSEGEHCTICLQDFRDRTVLPSCAHEFCFECILLWAGVWLIPPATGACLRISPPHRAKPQVPTVCACARSARRAPRPLAQRFRAFLPPAAPRVPARRRVVSAARGPRRDSARAHARRARALPPRARTRRTSRGLGRAREGG
jgi:hypothetical protein